MSNQPPSNEDYMNDAQKAHFTQILENWKQAIYEESKRTQNHLKQAHEPTADLNDRATLEEEFTLELRTRDRERKLLKKIEQALIRIQKNDFGYCEECGEEIGIKRLEARPTAELCIDCKQLSERREKHYYESR